MNYGHHHHHHHHSSYGNYGYGQYPPGNVVISHDANGQPIYTIQPMTFEQQMQYRDQMNMQRKAHVEKVLKEQFPLKAMYVFMALFGLSALVSIILQIVLLAKRAEFSVSCAGIIYGLIIFASLGVIFALTIKRTYGLFMCSIFVTSCAMTLASMLLFILNIIAIVSVTYCFSFDCPTKTNLKSLNIVMIVIGVLSLIGSTIFMIFLVTIGCSCTNANNQNNITPGQYPPNSSGYQYTTNENL